MVSSKRRCLMILPADSEYVASTARLASQFDLKEIDAERVDARDFASIADNPPYAIILSLSLPRYTALRIAEVIAANRLSIRLILITRSSASAEVLEQLFDVVLRPPVGNGLESLLLQGKWSHAFERRTVTVDTAIIATLRSASCFWLSGFRHPELFATLVDYQQAISEEKRSFRILFFASDPSDLARLRLIKEFAEVEGELAKKSDYSFSCKHAFAARPDEMMRRLIEERPHIVHFSGHGGVDGRLCFEDAVGRVWPADKSAVAMMFEPVRRHVKCVVLNSCYSSDQARLIGRHAEYTIGLNASVPDDAAIALAKGFYGGLAASGRVSTAIHGAKANLKLLAGDEVGLDVTWRTDEYGAGA